MVTLAGTCEVCRKRFEYRRRGAPQITCSPECRKLHRQRMTNQRVARLAVRRMAVGPLGYSERLLCRAEPENASQAATCEQPARVLYVDLDGATYALCDGHDTEEARGQAAGMGLTAVRLPRAEEEHR